MNIRDTITQTTAALAIAATLAACETTGTSGDAVLERACEEYCEAQRPRGPGAFQLTKQVFTDGRMVQSPMRDIFLLSGDGKLVTPYDASYSRAPVDGGLPVPDKAEGLEPSCFASAPYSPPSLLAADLDHKNTTITFINFDRDGRVESRELSAKDPSFALIDKILSTSSAVNGSPEYQQIQNALSARPRPDSDRLYDRTGDEPPVRVLKKSRVPLDKTPFHKDLSIDKNFSDGTGHIFFYVLVDKGLEFSRSFAALLPYAPQSTSTLQTLYAPFVQYPVYPETPGGEALDVLTFHFIRDPGLQLKNGPRTECRYTYDLHVIAQGQAPFEQATPLFIDPEVKTRGIILP